MNLNHIKLSWVGKTDVQGVTLNIGIQGRLSYRVRSKRVFFHLFTIIAVFQLKL